MTVIAWDGKTLASDKRVSYQGLSRTVTKIWRVKDYLVGYAGMGCLGMEMLKWLDHGRSPTLFPALQRDKDDWGTCVVVLPTKKILVYERTPEPCLLEDRFFACGAGRDYAVAAMHLGCDARKAVEVACLYEITCGNGVDSLDLPELRGVA